MLDSAINVLRNFIDTESVGARGIFGAFLVYAGRPSGPTSCCRELLDDVRWNFDLTFCKQCDDDEVGWQADCCCGGGGGGGARDGHGNVAALGRDCEGESDRLRVCFVKTSARLPCMTSWYRFVSCFAQAE